MKDERYFLIVTTFCVILIVFLFGCCFRLTSLQHRLDDLTVSCASETSKLKHISDMRRIRINHLEECCWGLLSKTVIKDNQLWFTNDDGSQAAEQNGSTKQTIENPLSIETHKGPVESFTVSPAGGSYTPMVGPGGSGSVKFDSKFEEAGRYIFLDSGGKRVEFRLQVQK